MSTAERDQIIADHVGLVHYVARRYRSHNDYEDLVQAGLEGLIYAVDHFDPTARTEFSTYAVPSIRGSIQHYLRDKSSSVRIPARLQELSHQVSTAIDELTQQHGTGPTIPNIAAYLGLQEDDVLQAMDANVARITVSTSEDHSPLAHLAALDTSIEDFDNSQAIQQALSTLPIMDQQAVKLRFFANKSQTQIAQELGISQMQVSRILTRALRELRPLLRDI
ncbi:MAG: sigma-70 family RNA polymerase sigma factor [Candidatus Nanopelagicales bacterium]|nr:sigma-70 family RNA polymerase sigma factor [Candidatus Nanopelagicales bacterium]